MTTLRAVMTPAAIDANHRRRLIADNRKAAKLGMGVDDFRAQRTKAVEQLTRELRDMLEQHNVDDPVTILPEILIAHEQRILSEAMKAAASAARFEIQKLLRKAALP
jgi:hypothetical protein